MGRKRNNSPRRKKGGLLMGLRGGTQKLGRGLIGAGKKSGGDADKPKLPWYKGMNLVWNVLTAAACVLAAAVLLRRCGVVKF